MKSLIRKILKESLIDNLSIPKIDKAILKTIHSYSNEKGSYGDNVWDLSDGEKLIKISEALGFYDYDYLYKLYKLYLKHKDFIFNEMPTSDIEATIDPIEDYELVRPILLKYMVENYVGKKYNVNGFEWIVDTPMGDLSEALTEGADSIELFTNIDGGGYIIGYCMFMLMKRTIDKGNGFDVMSQDEDLSAYNGLYNKGRRFEEQLQTGYIKGIEFPKNLKDETLKKYFDELFKSFVEGPITNSTEIILDYQDHVNAQS